MVEPSNNTGNNGALPEIVTLDALALSAAIRAHDISCREVMLAYLDHIEQHNPKLNAIVSLREPELLLAEADERDQQLARGQWLGWMHGIPQAVKDLADCTDLPTRAGSPLTSSEPVRNDGLAVARVRASGAIFLGKTNVPEFGLGSQTYNTVFGVTRNAYDDSRNAGGSSGGAAVALAARMLPVADGSDMMGSLRNPAAYNNVYGFRPSFGRVPSGPAKELFQQQLGTEGPMGRTIADVARLLSTQAGYDARAPLSLEDDPTQFANTLQRDFTGVRLGWLGNYNGYLPMEAGILDLCTSALTDFSTLGCTVDVCCPNYEMDRLWHAWVALRSCSTWASINSYYANPHLRELLKPEAQWEAEISLGLRAEQIFQASVDRSDWYRALAELFTHYDFLLLPTAQMFPFDVTIHWPHEIEGRQMDTYHRWMEVAIGPSLAGVPAINVPIGFNEQGLPMGLQIIGPPRADFAVLQLAHAYEQQTQWVRNNPPPIVARV